MTGNEDSGSARFGGFVPGFRIRGMEPQRNIYDFMITIDAEFADALRGLEASEEQVGSAEHIEGALTHDMADVRFVGESFLLRGITVGFQATGLDLYKEELGRQQYATHNVDSPSEAIQVVAAFSRWEELANTILKERREDDGLRADGGTTPSGRERRISNSSTSDNRIRARSTPRRITNGHSIVNSSLYLRNLGKRKPRKQGTGREQ